MNKRSSILVMLNLGACVRQDGAAQVGGNTGLKRCAQEMKMHHWVTSQGETVAKGISKGLE